MHVYAPDCTYPHHKFQNKLLVISRFCKCHKISELQLKQKKVYSFKLSLKKTEPTKQDALTEGRIRIVSNNSFPDFTGVQDVPGDEFLFLFFLLLPRGRGRGLRRPVLCGRHRGVVGVAVAAWGFQMVDYYYLITKI